MPRLRTIVIAAVVVVVATDVTWDGKSLHISVGWPGRTPVASFVLPMTWTEFTTTDDGPLIAGLRAGSGPPVLLLHGGPGVGFETCADLGG